MLTGDGEELASRLAQVARLVELHLESYFAKTQAAGTPERLVAAMRHAVLAGGKRFRPFLVMEFAALAGGDEEIARDAAAALECVHAYSLVHDDLPAMDNDELRRGRPTVWKAYDEWTAILAGDALLTMAFEILAPDTADARDPVLVARLVRELAVAAGSAGMVGGQMLDLEAEKLGRPARPDVAHVRRLQAMKTGRLITYACRAGALSGGVDERRLAAATAYGDALGLAFQIADDLLDVTGDAATVGKAVGKDAALGKATLVAVLGEHEARAHLHAAVGEAHAALEVFGVPAPALREAADAQLHRDR